MFDYVRYIVITYKKKVASNLIFDTVKEEATSTTLVVILEFIIALSTGNAQ